MPNACDCTTCIDGLELPSGKVWCHDKMAECPSSHCCQKYQDKLPRIDMMTGKPFAVQALLGPDGKPK
jgi:hypothetical protein